MFMIDGNRRYVEVNRPASLWFRLSRDEMLKYTVDDVLPPSQTEQIRRDWVRMLDTGCVAGHWVVATPNGSQVDLVYFGAADVLPGLPSAVFATCNDRKRVR